MSDNYSLKNIPKLSFVEPEVPCPGMQVHELNLNRSGVPTAPFNASYDRVDPGCTSLVDSHLVHEIWLIASGEGELTYDNRLVQIRPGDIVYFQPTKEHQLKNNGVEPIVFFAIWWDD